MLKNRRLLITAFAACGLGMLTACTSRSLEESTVSTAPQLVVHAVLNPRLDGEFIVISRAHTGIPSTISGGIGDDEPVLGAQVTVTAPDGSTMTASAVPPDCSCPPGFYAISEVRSGVALAMGSTYTLHVRTTLGEEASGSTTIPQAPNMRERAPIIFIRARDTLWLTWPRVPGARSYEVIVVQRGRDEIVYRTFVDTSIAMPGRMLTIEGDDVFQYASSIDVIVSAVDANYYDYYRSQSDPFAGAAPTRLIGAVGVFGSNVPMLLAGLEVR
jgi:hypothetical protein